MGAETATIEVVAIGEELLTGATIDRNAARIARELEPIGWRVSRKTTVGDVPEAIATVVSGALERTRAVITTGGLGPTRDDATKASVAAVFGRALEFREDLWNDLRERYGGDRPLPETNRSQAEVPQGAEVFPNPRGTAPGLAVEDPEIGLCILLPGVPDEMAAILQESVVPFLSRRLARGGRRPFRRQLRTTSVAEAAIAEVVADSLDDLPLDVAYLPEVDGVDIRLTYRGTSGEDAETILGEGERRLRETLGVHIYGTGDIDLVQVVGGILRERSQILAVAESCTGGLLAKRLTEWAGASDFFWGGVVVYDNAAKIRLADVPEPVIVDHGAVSEEAARAMAKGIARRSGAAASIAITGIAGPEGGTEDKPVGTVWLAALAEDEMAAERWRYPGTRDMVRARAAQGGLDLLRRLLLAQSS